jgi:LacI family transcriptional regulator
MPIVLLTRSLNLPEDCGAVYADEARTVDLALSHLWTLGHRRIAHVAGPVDAGPAADWRAVVDDIAIRRLEAYEGWMQAHATTDPALIAHARGWEGDHVPEIVDAWARLAEPPTAAFCANDALAVAVIAEARRRGWRVPEDLSVVGVDNSAAAAASDVPLTSIDVGMEAVGRGGTRALLQLMEGAPLEACRVALPVSEIVLRSSTARRTHGGRS